MMRLLEQLGGWRHPQTALILLQACPTPRLELLKVLLFHQNFERALIVKCAF